MKARWVVELVREPTFPYPRRYFPRKFAYKSDALLLQREVELKGGQAKVEEAK